MDQYMVRAEYIKKALSERPKSPKNGVIVKGRSENDDD